MNGIAALVPDDDRSPRPPVTKHPVGESASIASVGNPLQSSADFAEFALGTSHMS